MDLTVEMWPVERLVPYARNPRKNDEQVEKMAASIREFGFRIPVVAKSDGSVIDGAFASESGPRARLVRGARCPCGRPDGRAGEGVPHHGQQVGGVGGMG